MTTGTRLQVVAGGLALSVAACASPATGNADLAREFPFPGQTRPPVPCNALIIDSANYTDELALRREDQMKLMRFASEDAMNAYIAETARLRGESNRITRRLDDILQRYGGIPDYHFIQFESPTDEESTARIAAADACADEALK